MYRVKMFLPRFCRVWPPTRLWSALLMIAMSAFSLSAQNEPLHVIAFGEHPDDCDIGAGGLAAKYAALGHKVKFVSLTNGAASLVVHHPCSGGRRRRW